MTRTTPDLTDYCLANAIKDLREGTWVRWSDDDVQAVADDISSLLAQCLKLGQELAQKNTELIP